MKRLLNCIVLLIACGSALAAQDRGLIWRLQAPGANLYLLGSIHFADASFYPLRKEIEQAFAQSDKLVVEVDINAAAIAAMQKIIQEQGSYSGADTIRNHIRAETYASLREQLQTLGVPYSLVERQKPAVVFMTLVAMQMSKMGFMPEQGIDAHFLRRAVAQQKPVLQLESVEQQMNMMLGMADGDLLLEEALTSFEQLSETMDSLVQAWKQGDTGRLDTLLFADMLAQNPAYLAIYEQLFFERNLAMAKKIEHYLKVGGDYFVIIGAGHLIGDKSIVSLLESKGLKLVRF